MRRCAAWLRGLGSGTSGLKGNAVRLRAMPQLPPQLYAASDGGHGHWETGKARPSDDPQARRPAAALTLVRCGARQGSGSPQW